MTGYPTTLPTVPVVMMLAPMLMGVGFKSPGHAQRFLSAYGPIAQHFRPRRHRLSAPAYRQEMQKRYQAWGEITDMRMAA